MTDPGFRKTELWPPEPYWVTRMSVDWKRANWAVRERDSREATVGEGRSGSSEEKLMSSLDPVRFIIVLVTGGVGVCDGGVVGGGGVGVVVVGLVPVDDATVVCVCVCRVRV